MQHIQHCESSTRCLWCGFAPPTVSKLRHPFLLGTRCTGLKLRPVVSVGNKAIQCVAQRSHEHGGHVSSRWNFRHRFRFCILQMLYIPLVHKGEVVPGLGRGTPARFFSSLSYGIGLAASFKTSAIFVAVESLLRLPFEFFLRFDSMTICSRFCGTGKPTGHFSSGVASCFCVSFSRTASCGQPVEVERLVPREHVQ